MVVRAPSLLATSPRGRISMSSSPPADCDDDDGAAEALRRCSGCWSRIMMRLTMFCMVARKAGAVPVKTNDSVCVVVVLWRLLSSPAGPEGGFGRCWSLLLASGLFMGWSSSWSMLKK